VEATELSLPDNDAKTDADLYPDPENDDKVSCRVKIPEDPSSLLAANDLLVVVF
jgi:hypothetical protein